MQLKSLKPLHGWRAFFGEVGVVVLGVLLALGAQQAVQDIQMRSDVREFRRTIDHEIALNLFTYDVRDRQVRCVAQRIAQLRSWLDKARAGSPVPPIHAGGPFILTQYRSAWDNRDAQVFNHLPLDVRQKYAEFYDELTNNAAQLQQESDYWRRLWPYVEPGPISLQDRRIIRTTLALVDNRNRDVEANFEVSRKIASAVGVTKSIRPDEVSLSSLSLLATCVPVIMPTSTTKS
jgi:hypothetical protein